MLGDIADSVDYGVTASAIPQPVGPKFLRITDIQGGGVNWDDVPWCECDTRTAIDAHLKSGDIVFARTGATTGKSFLIDECPPNAVFASYLIRVRMGGAADARYVGHFFQTPDYWAQITKGARGAAQPGVNATTLKALSIPLPPLPEQRRIAAVLDRAVTLRNKRRAALGLLDTLPQILFADLLAQVASGNYPSMSLGEAVDLVTVGHVGPTSEFFCDAGIPFLRTGNVGKFDIVMSELKHITPDFHKKLKKSVLKDGDLLVSRVISDEVRCAIVPPALDGANCANVIVIRPGKRMTSQYLAHLIRSPESQRAFLKRQVGSAQSVVNTGVLQSWQITLPPLNVQHNFERRIAAVDKLKAAHRASIAELDSLFAALQHRAFRGEL